MTSTKKPIALAIGATLAGGLLLSGSAFASTPLAQGYLLAAQGAAPDKAKEGKCGADKGKTESADKAKAEGACGAGHAGAEGKCGEGKCGMAKLDADKDGRISKAEFAVAHDGKDDKFAAHDLDGDGYVSAEEIKTRHADKAGAEGKCGEGKCGADHKPADGKAGAAKAAEGKCGEGKCGGAR